jgi:hypothetical protein
MPAVLSRRLDCRPLCVVPEAAGVLERCVLLWFFYSSV